MDIIESWNFTSDSSTFHLQVHALACIRRNLDRLHRLDLFRKVLAFLATSLPGVKFGDQSTIHEGEAPPPNMSGDITTWALPRISRLLPIDDESLREIIAYTASLSKEAGAEHLKNLLGDSAQALEFISSFNSRRPEVAAPKPSPQGRADDGGPRPGKRPQKKPKAPLHNAGPVRQPAGYGDVTGGYSKTHNKQDYGSDGQRQTPAATSLSDSLALNREPDALQMPKVTQGVNTGSATASRNSSPARRSEKLPPSASGNLISEFLPNVRSKQSKKPAHASHSQSRSGTSTPHGKASTTTTTSSISDLTAAIAALELSTNPSLSSERRKCPCNASIHPLFATAPNCLNCGKIICALEGLQPCSFCDAPILSKDQVNSMIQALKEERGVERMLEHNVSHSRSGRGTPMFGGSTPDSSGDESSSAAARARAHRDKLLAYQRDNAQRTRVHDEAADYDVTLTPGTTQWMSPVQRAAALKKQQQYMREMEEANRPEWERKKTVMSMSIKNGKLVKTFEKAQAPSKVEQEVMLDSEEDIREDASQHLSTGTGGAFSNNPLLQSGKLIRPIWKPQDGDSGKGKVRADGEDGKPRKSVWRRVQDDNEDNEQWILDGGLRGYGTESRLMEDGSQQESG